MRILIAATAVSFAAAPVGVHAVEYLSADEAQKLMFPDADRFEDRNLSLDARQLHALAAQGVTARSARWPVRLARRGEIPLGYVVFDRVVGKAELIDYGVALGLDGAIKQVEVLAYRESHGQEIRLPAWRRQFVGKNEVAPIRLNDDIANISGATLSCTHVTEGIHRIVAVVAEGRRSGALAP